MRYTCLTALLFALLAALRPVAAERVIAIDNPLNLSWQRELIYVDAPADAQGDWRVSFGDVIRPAQLQQTPEGRRLWFQADIRSAPRGQAPQPAQFRLEPGRVDSPLTMIEHADRYEIRNGVYAVSVARYAVNNPAGVPLRDLPGLIQGVSLMSEATPYGRSHFASDARVVQASTTVVERGPVFITLRVDMTSAGEGQAVAPDEPNTDNAQPRDFTSGRAGAFYTATLRFTAEDDWADIDEQYRLAPAGEWWMEFRDARRFDTVMWIRWFGYERFGGNDRMNYVALQPQKMQRGPFVALRPRWSQAPGGGQDFFITRGGEPTPAKPEDEAKAYRPSPYDADAASVGIVAVRASRWFNPYAQTISCFAENGDTARIRFPLNSGSRSWALVVGPRKNVDNTGRLNSLVRRRADWTLQKQMAAHLTWERDASKAGPHILIERGELERLKAQFAAGADTPEMRIVRQWEQRAAEMRKVASEHSALAARARDSKLTAEQRAEAEKQAAALRDQAQRAQRDLGSDDFRLLDAIAGRPLPAGRLPSGDLWLARRYQDDFLNPTQSTVRRLPGDFTSADLAANGKPWGGPMQAAIAYIFSDPDHWPGWANGWSPGNPNFHTDKYMVVAFAAASLLDHPHSARWMAFARKEFDDDIARVMFENSGVGYECPGYAGYSLKLQLQLARVFQNTGAGNVVADNPRFALNAVWHRHLLTPVDPRLGFRHAAPIGDTHRWTSGMGNGFAKVARFLRESKPALAAELMATFLMLEQQGGVGRSESLIDDLLLIDRSIAPADLGAMDWGSGAFDGFGAIFRSGFATDRETFLTLKAGRARGHYHNDEMSWHFYGAGTPLSLDYNCSYAPRGDHAALHNRMTFGRTVRDFRHIGEDKPVLAMEQPHAAARVVGFARTELADAVIAELKFDRLALSAVYPDDAKFQYSYPTRTLDRAVTHRRAIVLVKHPAGAGVNDFLVVRDDSDSREEQQINIHLLTRDLKQEGNVFRGVGQWDADISIHLVHADLLSADVGRWWYFDDWMRGPGQYGPRDSEENRAWAAKVRETDGRALVPPEGIKGKWQVGEYQQWLRLHTRPGSSALYVLYPQKRGQPEPQITPAGDNAVRVRLGEIDQTITINAEGSVKITRAGTTVDVLPATP